MTADRGLPARILIAGLGNVLRQDDGFGVAVARRLLDGGPPPAGVTIVEAGIAGVRVVQDLMDGYDGLILIDAVERGAAPGTLYELEPGRGTAPAGGSVPDVAAAPDSLHTVEPSRILTLARAAGCLPARVLIIGCEPGDAESLTEALTPPVEAAVPQAIAVLLQRVRDWQGRIDRGG